MPTLGARLLRASLLASDAGNTPALAQIGAVSNGPAHPVELIRPTVFADTTLYVRGVRAVLEVLAPGYRQSSIQLLGPFLVSPGEAKHPIRGQPEVTEYRPERLARVDGVEELLPHLDGQACFALGLVPRLAGCRYAHGTGCTYSRCANGPTCRGVPHSRPER
jgi:hypothetical protein